MSTTRQFFTSALLAFFGVWDLALATMAIAFPAFWFRMFHDTAYIDPQALLARTGGVWAAFALFHWIAFFRWRDEPYWLVVVGGMRLSEIFADLIYLFRAQHVTVSGTISLLLATPSNVFFAIFFIQGFLLLQPRERRARAAIAGTGAGPVPALAPPPVAPATPSSAATTDPASGATGADEAGAVRV